MFTQFWKYSLMSILYVNWPGNSTKNVISITLKNVQVLFSPSFIEVPHAVCDKTIRYRISLALFLVLLLFQEHHRFQWNFYINICIFFHEFVILLSWTDLKWIKSSINLNIMIFSLLLLLIYHAKCDVSQWINSCRMRFRK